MLLSAVIAVIVIAVAVAVVVVVVAVAVAAVLVHSLNKISLLVWWPLAVECCE